MRAMLAFVVLSSALAIASVGVVGQSSTTTNEKSVVECTTDGISAVASQGSTITSVANVAGTNAIPAHCQVDGRIETPGNVVGFRLRLPTAWNGKFFFHGVGGFGGNVEPAAPSAIAPNNMLPALIRGYATASTDTGHQGISTDASWALNNPAKELDYGHRGTHAATVAAKALTARYYGSPPVRSYFAGCSNGGGQALMEAQRYPDDFDGIIAGAPSFRDAIAARTLEYQRLLSSKENYIPASKLDLISNAVLRTCDAGDGLKDGLVSNPLACKFNPETLLCAEGDGPNCLTKGQVASLKALYSGFSTKDGKHRTYRRPVGHEAGGWQSWILGAAEPTIREDGRLVFTSNPPQGYRYMESGLRYLTLDRDDPTYDFWTFNFDRDVSRLEKMKQILSPADPDLRPFRASDGKLLIYHGWADPALSAFQTIAYFDQVVRTLGGKAQADEFVRLFLAPGMHHCSGGPGPNSFVAETITALEKWVDQGIAPTEILASHRDSTGKVDRTRPLCPYPQQAVHKGSGSIDEAANFRCEVIR